MSGEQSSLMTDADGFTETPVHIY